MSDLYRGAAVTWSRVGRMPCPVVRYGTVLELRPPGAVVQASNARVTIPLADLTACPHVHDPFTADHEAIYENLHQAGAHRVAQ